MEQRERLIELLKGAETEVSELLSRPLALDEWLGMYADHLLANGVIVSPCKVGDIIYYINENPLNLWVKPNTIHEADVVRVVTTKLGTSLVIQIHNEFGCAEIPNIKDFGKTVFTSREEAQAELERRNK